jgi:hypothetical protein
VARTRGATPTHEELDAARAEARRQIDERDRFVRQWGDVADFRNGLVEQMRLVERRYGKIDDAIHAGERDPDLVARWKMLRTIRGEIKRQDCELVRLLVTVGIHAWRDETESRATIRILLERGWNPTAIARGWKTDATSAEISDTSERVTAQNIRTKYKTYCAHRLPQLKEALARAAHGTFSSLLNPHWNTISSVLGIVGGALDFAPRETLVARVADEAARLRAVHDAITSQNDVTSAPMANV